MEYGPIHDPQEESEKAAEARALMYKSFDRNPDSFVEFVKEDTERAKRAREKQFISSFDLSPDMLIIPEYISSKPESFFEDKKFDEIRETIEITKRLQKMDLSNFLIYTIIDENDFGAMSTANFAGFKVTNFHASSSDIPPYFTVLAAS